MASTYTMVAYGSQGRAVRQLQNELNKRGYSLDQDGIFGKKTRAAVRDYQKKNGLTMVDGIAGDETWGSLLSAPTAAEQAAQAAAAAEAAAPRAEVTAGTARRLQELERGYTPSDEVTAAQAYRDSVAALEPEAYRSRFEERLQALYDQIAGREAFDYDPEEDESYQRYARLYAARGAAAMEDTLGKAAALTGGYASSYAQSAGSRRTTAICRSWQRWCRSCGRQRWRSISRRERLCRTSTVCWTRRKRRTRTAGRRRVATGRSSWRRLRRRMRTRAVRTRSCIRRCWHIFPTKRSRRGNFPPPASVLQIVEIPAAGARA